MCPRNRGNSTGANAQRCGGTKKLTAYRVNWKNESKTRSLGYSLTDHSAGCGEKIVTIPKAAFSTQKSAVDGHEGLYVALLEIKIDEDAVVDGPRSIFRIYPSDTSNVRLGFWGLHNSGEGEVFSDNVRFNKMKEKGSRAVGLYVQGENNTIRYKFAPPCVYNDGNPDTKQFLHWSDDDRWGEQNTWGSSGKQAYLSVTPGNEFNMPQWIRNSPNWQPGKATSGKVWDGRDPVKSFQWAGEGGHGLAKIQIVPGKKYTVKFDKMTSGSGMNVLVVWYPFDSGDFDLDCPPQPGWQLKPKSSEINRRTGVAFNYTKPTGTTAEQNATRVANRKSAAQALRKVEFKHTLTNAKLPGYKHVKTSRARGSAGAGCYDGVSLSGSYCARIQQQVIRADGTEGGWKWRFGYQDDNPNKTQVDSNGFSQYINPRETVRVARGFDNKAFSPIYPPAYDTGSHGEKMSDGTRKDSNVDYRLDRVEPGDRYCERLVVKHAKSTGGGGTYSPRACVTLGTDSFEPYWNVKPMVDTKDMVQQGDPVKPDGKALLPVKDTDWDDDEDIDEPDATGENYTKITNADYQISRFKLPADRTLGDNDFADGLTEVTTNNQASCAWINAQLAGASGTSCSAYSSGKAAVAELPLEPKSEPTRLPHFGSMTQDTTADIPIGGKLCYLLSFSRPQAGHEGDDKPEMTWRHSKAACTTVAKKPKVWFRNGDLRAGRGIQGHNLDGSPADNLAACPTPDPSQKANVFTVGVPTAKKTDPMKNLYGSWVEYGVFATGQISGFGSAAIPTGLTDDPSTLAFSNSSPPNGTVGGQYQFGTSCQANYFAWVGEDHEVPTTRLTGGLNLSSEIDDAKPSFVKASNVDVSGTGVTGSRILHVRKAPGQKGDITITGNITMNPAARPLAEMPQIILIADGDITINAGVTQIDAWLIAKGQISTCHIQKPNGTQCDKQLTLTGPIAASKLNLRRTHGADLTQSSTAWQPAEEFRLNPIHLLRRYGPTNPDPNQGAVISEKDLPPWY